jgi:hypothetical protein
MEVSAGTFLFPLVDPLLEYSMTSEHICCHISKLMQMNAVGTRIL